MLDNRAFKRQVPSTCQDGTTQLAASIKQMAIAFTELVVYMGVKAYLQIMALSNIDCVESEKKIIKVARKNFFCQLL